MTENAELERYATDSDDPRTSSAGTGPGPSMNITWRGAGKPHKYRLVDRKQNVEMKGRERSTSCTLLLPMSQASSSTCGLRAQRTPTMWGDLGKHGGVRVKGKPSILLLLGLCRRIA